MLALSACKSDKKTDSVDSQNNPKHSEKLLKRYDVKSGIVQYKTTISGNVMGSVIQGEGTQSLYFKDWGAKELREEQSIQTTKVSIMGHNSEETSSTHTMNKLDNGEVYTVNFDEKSITKMRDPLMDMFSITDTDAGDAGKRMMESMGGKKTGEETYQGYDCEIWELMGTKQWVYKGVTLKIVANLMGVSTITEATKVKFDTKVSNDKFKLPDFPIVEQESFIRNEEMKEEMKEMQKEMKALKKMSFQEWKKMVQVEDQEMKQMTDEELKEIYDMMQKMAQ